MRNSIVDLAGSRGGRAYILGNSVSLRNINLDALGSDRSALTIGVNRLLQVFSPNFLLVADKLVLQEELDRLHAAKPKLLVLRELDAKPDVSATLAGIDRWTWSVGRVFTPKRARPFLGYEPKWQHGEFLRSGNTGTYAIEAAALMGCTEIRLLGIDLRFDLKESHFFGVNKHNGQRIRHKQNHLRRLPLAYRAIHDKLKEMGVQVINESPIPGPLDEWIPREKSPWLKT